MEQVGVEAGVEAGRRDLTFPLPPAEYFAGELERVDRLIAEQESDGDYPGRDRFLNHLRSTRDVLEVYYRRQMGEQGLGSRD